MPTNLPQRKNNKSMSGDDLLRKAMTGSHIHKSPDNTQEALIKTLDKNKVK